MSDVFLHTNTGYGPSDVILRTSAVAVAAPASGHSIRRRVIVDDWIPPDIYLETRVVFALTVTHASEAQAANAFDVHEAHESSVEVLTEHALLVNVRQSHNAPFVFDALDLLELL